jgi:hypothetical protein
MATKKKAKPTTTVGGFVVDAEHAEEFRDALTEAKARAREVVGASSVERHVALWNALQALREVAKKNRTGLARVYDRAGLRATDVNKAKRIAEALAICKTHVAASAWERFGVAAVDCVGELARLLRKAGVDDAERSREVGELVALAATKKTKVSELRARVKATRDRLKAGRGVTPGEGSSAYEDAPAASVRVTDALDAEIDAMEDDDVHETAAPSVSSLRRPLPTFMKHTRVARVR